ncbi:MAG: hypothetical protein K8S99_15975 [Planctomycetes bacterium]|nr:hypothetical protein [Planctomycetota bacterium]
MTDLSNPSRHYARRWGAWTVVIVALPLIAGCESDGGRMMDKGGNLGANIGALLLEPMGWSDTGASMGRSIGQAPGSLKTTSSDRAQRNEW